MCLDLRRYQQMIANLFVHSDSDVEGLIRRASIPCKAYLQILRDTHADQSEIAKLLFQDVDVANLTVTLTKTNGQRRTVPISIEAVNLILALHNRRCKRFSLNRQVKPGLFRR